MRLLAPTSALHIWLGGIDHDQESWLRAYSGETLVGSFLLSDASGIKYNGQGGTFRIKDPIVSVHPDPLPPAPLVPDRLVMIAGAGHPLIGGDPIFEFSVSEYGDSDVRFCGYPSFDMRLNDFRFHMEGQNVVNGSITTLGVGA